MSSGEQSHANKLAQRAAQATVAAGMLAAYFTANLAGNFRTPRPQQSFSFTPHALIYDGNGCVAPTTGDYKATDSLLAQPENPAILTDIVGEGKGAAVDPHITAQGYRQEMADYYGVTIYDATPVINQLVAEDQNGNLSYEVYLEATQNFVQQFGVDLTLGNEQTTYAYGGRSLTDTELNSANMKVTLLGILSSYSNLPVEYVQLAGQKHMVLVGGLAQNGVAAYAEVAGPHDTTVFDASIGISRLTVMHEMGHLMDTTMCSVYGIGNDSTLADLTADPDAVYNGQTFNRGNNTDDFQAQYIDADLAAQHARQDHNYTLACRTMSYEQLLASMVATVSQYHPNTAEEKAEILSYLGSPDLDANILDPEYTQLYAQVRLVLARLEAIDPRVAGYLMAVGRRGTPVTDAIMCMLPNNVPTASGSSSPIADPNAQLKH